MLRACQLMKRKSEPPSWESLQDTPVNSDTTKLQLSKSQLQHSAESLLWKSLIPDWCVLIPAHFCSQSCRSALQILHKACEVARRYNYFPGGMALVWATYYESCISSDQSCINEWNAMQDLESTRPDSPALFVDKSVLSFIMKSWLGSQEKSPFVPFVLLWQLISFLYLNAFECFSSIFLVKMLSMKVLPTSPLCCPSCIVSGVFTAGLETSSPFSFSDQLKGNERNASLKPNSGASWWAKTWKMWLRRR